MKNLNISYFLWGLVGFSGIALIIAAKTASVAVTDWLGLLKLLPNVVTADGVLVTVFVKWGWRWKCFHPWLVPFPDLNGTWQGAIRTTWVDPTTGARPGPIPVILAVRQSFLTIHCKMMTPEMKSTSYAADFMLYDGEQRRQLAYSYRSTPKPTVIDRSAPHDGTIVFDLVGTPTTKLVGEYWTARKTTGEVELIFREKTLLEEFPRDLGVHPVSGK